MSSKAAERIAFTLAAVCGVAWLGSVLSPPTRGRDWRGYAGVVRLAPTVVYRFTLSAPLDAPNLPSAEEMRSALEATGARSIAFRSTEGQLIVEFDQSFGEARELNFHRPAVGPFRPVLARRLDGLDWEAP